MCTVFLAYRQHPDYPIILAANRDEFYKRPTAPASFWKEAPRILAGKDLQEGGTWMGITRNGRFAVLTNFRSGFDEKATAQSRGRLVKDYLMSDLSVREFEAELQKTQDAYNGFNLLFGQWAGQNTEIACFSNRSEKTFWVDDGLYGLSNHLWDSSWPKVEYGKQRLSDVLVEGNEILYESCFDILEDQTTFPDEQLPNTGIPIEWERNLSSIFIALPEYGTRASSLILVNNKGYVDFYEKTIIPNKIGRMLHDYHFQIKIFE